MSIKTWRERLEPPDHGLGIRAIDFAMQAEIDELRAKSNMDDAMLAGNSALTQGLRVTIAAQRKVLEQVTTILRDIKKSIDLKRVWKDSDGSRMDEAVAATITAIQEQLGNKIKSRTPDVTDDDDPWLSGDDMMGSNS